MKNIELKISVDNHQEIIKSLRVIKAKNLGILIQKDTYYNCPSGRLKLREINNKKYELIFYKRPNLKESKISDIDIINLNKKNNTQFNLFLSKAFGVFVIVNKKRNFWLYKNTRILLDDVKNLGKFLEIETVVKNNNMINAKKEYNEVCSMLNLIKYKRIEKSYSDLLVKNKYN